MTLRLGTAARNAAANGAADLLNGGDIRIRTSTPPTNVSDADSGTLLGTLTFSATAFGAASGGAKTANAIASDTNADASGTAGQARHYLSDHATPHSDASCGLGSGDYNFDNNVIVAGGTIAVSSMTWTQPI